jgi:dinuclear metal center YbgI/SA1388 family protein
MVTVTELTHYLAQLLETHLFKDFCPNGLQVEGKPIIKKIVSGVTASQALIEQAIELKADAILVHHGYFWRGEDPCIIGIKQQRLRKLLEHNINLLVYHLPLDAHAIYGNNVQLAERLELDVEHSYALDGIPNILWTGCLAHSLTGTELSQHIADKLQRPPLHIAGSAKPIVKVGWCTGAAQDFIRHAIVHNIDAYISGEISEQTVHIARETGIHFYAAGHHATERYGVQALGEHLAHYYGIQHQYVEIANPV